MFCLCERESARSHLLIHFPNAHNARAGLGAEAGSWELNPGLSPVTGSQLLEASLLPAKVYTGRKLNSGARARHQTHELRCGTWASYPVS